MSQPAWTTPGERREILNGHARGVENPPPAEPAERLSFAELAAANPLMHSPVVDGLVRKAEILNLISYSKIGKSWLGYSLLLSIITGQCWLGRFPTTSGKVLLIDNELHKPTIVHRILAVADALGIHREQFDLDLEVLSLRGRHRSLGEIALERFEPGEFQFILFDAKYRFAVGGVHESDNNAETLIYNLVDEIAERSQAAIGLIHHTSKGGQSDKRVTDVGSGAGAQARAADAHLVLREHEEPGVVVLEVALRSFAPVDPLALRWDFPLWLPACDVDPSQLKGRLSQGEQRQGERDKEGIDKILSKLLAGPATARELRTRTGLSRERQQRLLDKLTAEGHITTTPTTIRGRDYDQYALADDSQ